VDKFGQNYTYKRDGAYVTDPVLNEGFYKFTPGVSVRSNDTSRYYHHGIKNVNALSEQNKTLSAARQYDAFGNVVGSTGAWSGPFGYAGPFGYQEDSDSGLKLLGHRYYDPSTGRFLTRDPEEHGRNWYSYCENEPLTQVDSNGLLPAQGKGGKQDLRSSEFENWTDDQVQDALDELSRKGKLTAEEKKLKEKLQREQKARGARNKRKRKENYYQRPSRPLPVPNRSPRAPYLPSNRYTFDPEPVKRTAQTVSAAVVIYWILSVGSRIVFPPRNLIPVPE